MTSLPSPLHRAMLAALAALALAGGAAAQEAAPAADAGKSIAIEPVAAYPAFDRWTTNVLVVDTASTVNAANLRSILLQSSATPAGTYEPQPVIIGQPELPLIGAPAAGQWGPALNYQGVHMHLLVLDSRGRQRELKPMSAELAGGERFKIRIVSTFDAVANVDQVVGDLWYGQRAGQVYPTPGSSVALRAGETVDLPLEPNDYFVMQRGGNRRFVMSVRHAKASGDARSTQPAYRVDGSRGSNYLQLVPRGQYPAIEQLIAQTR